MVGLGMPEKEFEAAVEVVFLVISAEKACCWKVGPEAGRIEAMVSLVFFPEVSSSLLGGGARLDTGWLSVPSGRGWGREFCLPA